MATNTNVDIDSLIHHSLYGRPGAPATKRATAEDWKHKHFVTPATSPWDQMIPRSELPKLLNGVIPQQMEDKWFVYADGPDAQGNVLLHLYRSWTGYKMVEAKISVDLDENGGVADTDARFTELKWETDRQRYNGDMDAPDVVLSVAEWCMGCQLRPRDPIDLEPQAP